MAILGLMQPLGRRLDTPATYPGWLLSTQASHKGNKRLLEYEAPGRSLTAPGGASPLGMRWVPRESGSHRLSLSFLTKKFTMPLPSWVYLIFQEAQEGRKADIFTCPILKVRLQELKEAGSCPRSTRRPGWAKNPVLSILNLEFSGFKVFRPLQMNKTHSRIKSCSK